MIYIRIILTLLLFVLCECQNGVFKVSKIVEKSNGNRQLRAKCIYPIQEPMPGVVFDITFDMATTNFRSTRVMVLNQTGSTYKVTNIVDVVPNKFVATFSVIFRGDTVPTAICSSLMSFNEIDPPSLPERFAATIENSWKDNGRTRIHAACIFAIDATYQDHTLIFVVEFNQVVYRFEHWVMKNIAPVGDSGRWFHMTNLHWVNQPKLEFFFQASYEGPDPPTIYCSSPFPKYGAPSPSSSSTTATTTTTTKAATTTIKQTTTEVTDTTTVKPTSEQTTTVKVETTTATVGDPNQPNLPFSFPGTVTNSWNADSNNRTLEGVCKFAVDQTYKPESQEFIIDFGVDVRDFLNWVGKVISGTPNSWVHLKNLYWIHAGVMELRFQATYSTADQPDIKCRGTLPGNGVVNPTTQKPVDTTTQKPIDPTTQKPVDTTTQKPIDTTTQKPVDTTTQKPVDTTTQERTTTLPPDGAYNYAEVLMKSIWFYRAQRSGDLPVVANDPVPWRKDSALYDGNDVGRNLTGGWYDAGDWVKFNFPISSATAVLGWGLVQWKDAYISTGQYENMLDSIKWSLDFFLKCWDADNQVLYGQVGNGNIDHSKMMRPEEMTEENMPRPTYSVTPSKGGSDLAGSMVVAFAAGALAFKDSDPNYSNTLLNAAKSLYTFADQYRGTYTDAITDAMQFYPSSDYKDELVYAAAMLYKATGDNVYLQDAESKYNEFGFDYQTSWAFDWSDKKMGAKLLLFEATNIVKYSRDITTFLNEWRLGGSVTYTPGGLAWRAKWGSLRYSANTAFVSLMAASLGIDTVANTAWAKGQIDYMLGDNPRQSSYVVGFGINPPLQPHHKSSTCPPDPATCDWSTFSDTSRDNYYTLYGALVGGPDQGDQFTDVRTDYIMGEVTCDYNAGFQSAVAGLIHFNNQ